MLRKMKRHSRQFAQLGQQEKPVWCMTDDLIRSMTPRRLTLLLYAGGKPTITADYINRLAALKLIQIKRWQVPGGWVCRCNVTKRGFEYLQLVGIWQLYLDGHICIMDRNNTRLQYTATGAAWLVMNNRGVQPDHAYIMQAPKPLR